MPSLKSVGTAITIMLCLVMAVVTMSHLEASGTWSPTGSMSTSRFYYTATLLPDGRVLVSGGSPDGSSALGSAEIYDPALGTQTFVVTAVDTVGNSSTVSVTYSVVAGRR